MHRIRRRSTSHHVNRPQGREWQLNLFRLLIHPSLIIETPLHAHCLFVFADLGSTRHFLSSIVVCKASIDGSVYCGGRLSNLLNHHLGVLKPIHRLKIERRLANFVLTLSLGCPSVREALPCPRDTIPYDGLPQLAHETLLHLCWEPITQQPLIPWNYALDNPMCLN